MATEQQILSVINRIIQDEANGCSLCGSHNHLVYCEMIESSSGLLCKDCREEYLFDDEGKLKEDELEEAMIRVAAEYEDEEDEEFYQD